MSVFPLRRFFPFLVFALLPCLILWRVVFLGEAFVPADLLRDIAPWRTSSTPGDLVPWNPLLWDGVAEFYPWRLFAASSIRAGWIPLWNPHEFCGTPFVANSQSAVFYPLNLIFYVLPVKTAFGVSAWLHLTLTGIFMYGFLRRGSLKAGRTAAVLGAVVWQLSAWQTAWLALPTFLCVSAWLPLALLLTDKTIEHPTTLRAAGLGFCLGTLFLAGHLQIALYCFLLTATYALHRSMVTRLPVRRLLPLAIVTLALMAGLMAPQLLPALELSRVSHRAGGGLNWAGYQGYVGLATPLVYLVTLIFPGFFGSPSQGTYWGLRGQTDYPENACYVGILALGLACISLRAFRRSPPSVRFFAVAALAALLLALGTPLNALLYFGIPGFGQSGSPGRILVLWTFGAAVLAAAGMDKLLAADEPATGKVTRTAFGGLLLIGIVTLAATVWWLEKNAPGLLASKLAGQADVWRLPLGMTIGAGALIALRGRKTLSARVFGRMFIALAALDLLLAGVGYNHSVPPAQVYPMTPGLAFLQQHAGMERIMPVNHRWSLYAPPAAVLPPNAATNYGLFETQGYDSLLTGQYARFARDLNGWGFAPPENGNMVFTDGIYSPQAESAAARWIVSLGPLANASALRLAFSDGSMLVYENPAALRRARVTAGTGTATLTADSPNRATIRIDGASENGAAILADQWFPGWAAYVNGQKTNVENGPDVFRTVRWNQNGGTVTAEMRYLPTTFRVGLYAFMLTFFTGAGMGAFFLSERSRRGRL